jgi:hypothetical protein
LKYKPRNISKNATEISAPELFAKFAQYQTKEKGLMPSTVKAKYWAIERQLKEYLDLPAHSITKQLASRLTDV